jgi:two-component system cell cycle sensor histidine kinase/response regulator CckA
MSGTARATILVVDDEPEVRKLVCAMVAQLGYNVLGADNGPHALAIHKQSGPVDLLITDVVMHGMSGPALAERLGSLQPGLKVLYISGFEHSRVVQKYVVEPGHALLTKPFSAQELEARLTAMLAPVMTHTAR